MSDWKERLEAVATLANRPRPRDGEVYCANRTCGNRRLNRTDMTCWVCGGDRFIPASEEMRQSHRFTFVTPPRREEPKPNVIDPKQTANAPQTQAPQKGNTAPQSYFDILKKYQEVYEQSYQRQLAVSGLFPKPSTPPPATTVQFYDPPEPPTMLDRVKKWLKS